MKITRVEAIPYGIPIRKFADAYTGFSASNAVLVKLHAEDGTVGYGEACAWEPEFYGETVESITSTIENYLAPRLIGLDPLRIRHIMAVVDAHLARVTCVKEGIDLALHDLAGKRLGIPVATLLGGRFRDRIPVAAEIGIDTPDAMVQNALDVLDLGIGVIKIKGSADMELDVERIQAVREAVGEGVALRLDPNAAWSTTGTIRVMRALEGCRLQHLEQPVPGWDLDGMARIRNEIGIPLMADESIWTPQDVVRLHEKGAADLVNIKISKSCGLALGRKIETVAHTLGMPCMVGTEIEPGFSMIAKLHFAAAMERHELEAEFTELPLLEAHILDYDYTVTDGCLRVPDGPGFGVDLDEDLFKEFILK